MYLDPGMRDTKERKWERDIPSFLQVMFDKLRYNVEVDKLNINKFAKISKFLLSPFYYPLSPPSPLSYE
jgi:hypothetical protein